MSYDYTFLIKEAKIFAKSFSLEKHYNIYGINDGKSIGTYIENQFKEIMHAKYGVKISSSSKGIDFPQIKIDIKCTLKSRPQSSCPYKSFRQKIYGLGYGILLFTYKKEDKYEDKYSTVVIDGVYFIDCLETGDYSLTKEIVEILSMPNNKEKLIELFKDVALPCDEKDYENIANEVIINPPRQGLLTISNALQWRLQYSRVVNL